MIFFRFYSPGLEGFSGIGHSVEDCLFKAKWGIIDTHVKGLFTWIQELRGLGNKANLGIGELNDSAYRFMRLSHT